jgi:hypothetical protein
MTGYTVHTGSTEKFSSGWDRIFPEQAGKRASQSGAKKTKGAAKPRSSKTATAKKKKAGASAAKLPRKRPAAKK